MSENTNLEVIENVEVMDDCDISRTTGKKISKLAIGLTMAAGAGIGIWLYKRRKNRNERMIKQLEKAGYTVNKTEADDAEEETAE